MNSHASLLALQFSKALQDLASIFPESQAWTQHLSVYLKTKEAGPCSDVALPDADAGGLAASVVQLTLVPPETSDVETYSTSVFSATKSKGTQILHLCGSGFLCRSCRCCWEQSSLGIIREVLQVCECVQTDKLNLETILLHY